MSSEQELAAAVIDWLKAQHWEVYQEVNYCGDVADIVAVQGPALWVVECKVTLGLDVIAQAWRWISYAQLVSVGVMAPHTRRRSGNFVRKILRDYGIGLLQASNNYQNGLQITQDAEPPIHRPKLVGQLRKVLCEEQKNFAPAGNPESQRWSPFQRTARYVKEIVSGEPGICFKDMLARLDHHYASDASAKVSLRRWIEQGVIKGVRLERDGRYLKLYPEKRGELVE